MNLQTFKNENNQSVEFEYIIDPEHYYQGHQCENQCRTKTVNLEPGESITFNIDEDNASDISNQCIANSLSEL